MDIADELWIISHTIGLPGIWKTANFLTGKKWYNTQEDVMGMAAITDLVMNGMIISFYQRNGETT